MAALRLLFLVITYISFLGIGRCGQSSLKYYKKDLRNAFDTNHSEYDATNNSGIKASHDFPKLQNTGNKQVEIPLFETENRGEHTSKEDNNDEGLRKFHPARQGHLDVRNERRPASDFVFRVANPYQDKINENHSEGKVVGKPTAGKRAIKDIEASKDDKTKGNYEVKSKGKRTKETKNVKLTYSYKPAQNKNKIFYSSYHQKQKDGDLQIEQVQVDRVKELTHDSIFSQEHQNENKDGHTFSTGDYDHDLQLHEGVREFSSEIRKKRHADGFRTNHPSPTTGATLQGRVFVTAVSGGDELGMGETSEKPGDLQENGSDGDRQTEQQFDAERKSTYEGGEMEFEQTTDSLDYYVTGVDVDENSEEWEREKIISEESSSEESGGSSSADDDEKEKDEFIEAYGNLMGTIYGSKAVEFQVSPFDYNVDRNKKIIINFTPFKILSVNERQQSVTISSYVTIKWSDNALRWNISEHRDIHKVHLKTSLIWTPSIIIPRATGNDALLRLPTYAVVETERKHNVKISILTMFTSSCDLDLMMYPFDRQTCPILFREESDLPLNLEKIDNSTDTLLKLEATSGEWEIKNLTAHVTQMKYNRRQLDSVEFVISMSRRSTYYVANLLIPLHMTSFTALFVFWIPPETGEKISFMVSIYVSTAMYLTIVNDVLPRSLISLPSFNIIIVCINVQIALTIVASLFVLRQYRNQQEILPDKIPDEPPVSGEMKKRKVKGNSVGVEDYIEAPPCFRYQPAITSQKREWKQTKWLSYKFLDKFFFVIFTIAFFVILFIPWLVPF